MSRNRYNCFLAIDIIAFLHRYNNFLASYKSQHCYHSSHPCQFAGEVCDEAETIYYTFVPEKAQEMGFCGCKVEGE